jgi:uncharacterized metal-binding protein YceD (DUF177 family)
MDAILDWKYDTRNIPEGGLAVTRDATDAERASIATALNVIACKSLVARYTIEPLGHGRFRLEGSAVVTVTQNCVVTLDEIERTYTAPLEAELWPAEALADDAEDEETLIDPLGIDREPIENGRIDAGRIVYEELASAVDLYPRREGASFEWEDREGAARTHPFAALEKLKRKGE